ncbi:hypothetical protein GQ457_02G030630 [Hibiscus cannabinus]
MLLLYRLPMAKRFSHQLVTVLAMILLLISQSHSQQLESSQTRILLGVRSLLNYPDILSNWNSSIDFCSTEPTSQVTVVCYEESITQLHIIGSKGETFPWIPLSKHLLSFRT